MFIAEFLQISFIKFLKADDTILMKWHHTNGIK